MFAAGVPLVEAMDSVAGATGNAVYSEAVLVMRDQIATGQQLQQAMRDAGLFPNMVVQMIAVGESTGALDAMLNKIADFYDEEVDTSVDALTDNCRLLMSQTKATFYANMIVYCKLN